MKKTKNILWGLGILSAVTFSGYQMINEKPTSPLVMENIEALTHGEGVENCDNGCSTKNTRVYCCTLWGLKLYKYR